MSYMTTEEVADLLGITVDDVYRTRRNREYPGVLGRQRGRRLLFPADLVEAGPTEPESTNDPVVAILWTVQGIEAKLAEILKELRAQRPTIGSAELIESVMETTIEIEEEE